LNPSHYIFGSRSDFVACAMLLLLHGVLLSSEVSERYIRMYRVSHFKEKFMKSFSFFLKGVIAQLKSATVVTYRKYTENHGWI
jgi:hypothetical protein